MGKPLNRPDSIPGPASAGRGVAPAAFDLLTRAVQEYALFILDTAGVIVQWSEGARAMCGFAAEEVVGKAHAGIIAPEDVEAGLPQEALRAAAVEGLHVAEGWWMRKDGTRLWAEARTTPVRDDAGSIRGYACVLFDATHRMALHAALQKAAMVSEAQVHSILEAAVDAIITIDPRGRIGVFNRAAQALFGYTPAEVVGKNVSVLMPQPYKSEHDGYMHAYQRTGKKKIIGIGREVAALKKNGDVFPIDLAVSEVKVGDEVTFTGIIRDITERKRLEKEILEISEREQRRIGQDLHDGLCQQLTGIAFLMQALQQRLAALPGGEAAQAAQISSLLKEAVTQARMLSHGLYPVDPQPDGLMAALRELANSVRTFFNIDCVYRCPTSVMITENSVATHLYRIAQEAVQNAIRHGKASHVIIELLETRYGMQLTVSDNGMGFPNPDQLKSGMGLRTMNHRAHVIGATLSIGGMPIGGSRVTCDLPTGKGAHP